MRVIVCLDDKGGMTFNNRRQSRDRVLIADVVKMADGSKIFISQYSAMLFEESGASLVCDEHFLDLADSDGYCFVEDRALAPYADRIKEITVYKWNRKYPTDTYFDLDLSALGFERVSAEDLEGYSHEKITKEIYRR